MRLGLCCQFREEPIRFRTTTAKALQRQGRQQALQRLSGLCLGNAAALLQAVAYCASSGIGAFRVSSQILPLRTHPAVGFNVQDLPAASEIVAKFQQVGSLARKKRVRLSFHPDQFVLLNAPRPDVIASSIEELEYQAQVAEWIGADVINIHGGGGYGDKKSALQRFRDTLPRLSDRVRLRLTVENDDRVYTPRDLLPLCAAEDIPLVYDVHHHRCLPDGLGMEETTQQARNTWNREPLFHVSSPLEGWDGPKPQRHHDYIDQHDFPAVWLQQDLTVEVEAKAKERAVLRLAQELGVFRHIE